METDIVAVHKKTISYCVKVGIPACRSIRPSVAPVTSIGTTGTPGNCRSLAAFTAFVTSGRRGVSGAPDAFSLMDLIMFTGGIGDYLIQGAEHVKVGRVLRQHSTDSIAVGQAEAAR